MIYTFEGNEVRWRCSVFFEAPVLSKEDKTRFETLFRKRREAFSEIENESLNGEEIERVIAARFFCLLSSASNIQRFCIGAIFERVSTFRNSK